MNKAWWTALNANWKVAEARDKFLMNFSINLIVCISMYLLSAHYVYINRSRDGMPLNDPILRLIHPIDLSLPIFAITYSSIILFIYYVLPYPRLFSPALRAFTAVFVLRTIFIALTPLEPPLDMISLQDPFIDGVVGFKGQVSNDLFFSGHVADLYIFAFCCTRKWFRRYLFAAAILVSLMIVWQKVHYAADVLAAPFFSYACYSFFCKNEELPINEL